MPANKHTCLRDFLCVIFPKLHTNIHRLYLFFDRFGFKIDVHAISRARNHQENCPSLLQNTFILHLLVHHTPILVIHSPSLPPLHQFTLLHVCLSPPGSRLCWRVHPRVFWHQHPISLTKQHPLRISQMPSKTISVKSWT